MTTDGDQREDERDYLEEAKRILAGTTALVCEKRHLEALQELHECVLIRLACKVMTLHHAVMNSE